MGFFKETWEWFKLFFVEDKVPNAPSHKNLIGITLITVFAVAFLRKVAGSVDIPDIPAGWQLVILGLLGLRAVQSATEKFIEQKYNNGNTETKP